VGTVTYPTLEHVAMEARPYPTHLLEGCEIGLVLFAAAFLGHNDAVHFAEAGLETTCIDIDRERLFEMRGMYPDIWTFLNTDAFLWARLMKAGRQKWDVVSADTFAGSAMRRSLDSLDLWCSLARKVVTVTTTAGEPYDVPDGWKGSLFERAPSVFWLVLERA
jgi:hypothetical protein